jgi:ACR3 family arsenite transporter
MVYGLLKFWLLMVKTCIYTYSQTYAAPTSQIETRNHFEVVIAVITMLFGLDTCAALATVAGVLIEVPVMLGLVKICLSIHHWFK